MLLMDVIEPGNTPMFCRLLQAGSSNHSTLLSTWNINECIDSFDDSTSLSTLKANCSYCQVKMLDEDGNKTALSSHNGFFRSIQRPFGQTNVLGPFQHAMDIILSPVKLQFALVYLQDIAIFLSLQTNI